MPSVVSSVRLKAQAFSNLKALSDRSGRTKNALIAEGLEMLFQKYEGAELPENVKTPGA